MDLTETEPINVQISCNEQCVISQ